MDPALARYFATHLNGQSVKEHLGMIAWGLARDWYRRRHLGCPDAEAESYATRNCHLYQQRAVDTVIVLAVSQERREGAGAN